MSLRLAGISQCSDEMDSAIAKLQQNFQDLRNNLEKSFLDQGRALLRFEAQWKDLKTGHTRELEQRCLQLQQRGILLPSIGTQHWPTAHPNPTMWNYKPSIGTQHLPTAHLNPPVWNYKPSIGTPHFPTAHSNPPLWNYKPSIGTQHFPTGNPNHPFWTNNTTPLPPRDSTTKLYCALCNIYCDTKIVLDKHKMGKKHQTNLATSRGKIVAGQPQPPSKKKAVNPPEEEDWQTKKRRIIESGVPAHSLRICTKCNVVSNSEVDYYNHLTGQRHKDAVANNGAGTSSSSQPRIRSEGQSNL